MLYALLFVWGRRGVILHLFKFFWPNPWNATDMESSFKKKYFFPTSIWSSANFSPASFPLSCHREGWELTQLPLRHMKPTNCFSFFPNNIIHLLYRRLTAARFPVESWARVTVCIQFEVFFLVWEVVWVFWAIFFLLSLLCILIIFQLSLYSNALYLIIYIAYCMWDHCFKLKIKIMINTSSWTLHSGEILSHLE